MRLSEFKDEKAIEVVAALLGPISKIAQNEQNKEARGEGKTLMDFSISILVNNSAEVKDMLAILDGEDPENYHCTAATVLRDVFNMVSDPDLMSLFGFRRQTPPSSGSVSENTEGQSE